MRFTGKLKRVDVGTGAWVLETGSGERIALFGDVPASLDGQRVEVVGREITDGASFAMVGDRMVEVSRVVAA